MYHEIAKLILYKDFSENSILYRLGEIFQKYETEKSADAELVKELYTQINRLLVVATDYGFNYNLWHNYLTF